MTCIAGTEKALTYLLKLHDDFDDWQLALAGYNWGEGNVAKAVARNKAKGLPTTYQSLAMPAETANYLPKLQAIKNIVRDPEKFGLVLADIPDAPYFAMVVTHRKMDTKFAADLAEMSLEDFLALNPQHNRPVIAGADEQTLLLPIDNAEIFAAKLELTNQPMVSWQAYRMRPNETLAQVAAKYGMSLETLRAVNGIGAKAKVPAGHTLLVPSQSASTDAVASLSQAVFTTVPAGRTFYYTAKKGDRLGVIAVRYGVTTQELKAWNGISSDALKPGQKVRVTSDVVPVQQGRRTHQAGGGDQGRRQAGAGRPEVPGGQAGRGQEQARGWPSSCVEYGAHPGQPRQLEAAVACTAYKRKRAARWRSRPQLPFNENGRRQWRRPFCHPSRPGDGSADEGAYSFLAAFFLVAFFLAAFFFGAAFFFVALLGCLLLRGGLLLRRLLGCLLLRGGLLLLRRLLGCLLLRRLLGGLLLRRLLGCLFFFGAAFFFVAFLAAFFFGAAFFLSPCVWRPCV